MAEKNFSPHFYSEYFTSDPVLNGVIKDLVDSGIFESPVSHTWLSHLGDTLELPCAQRIENNAHVFRVTREINEFLSAARFYVSGPYGRRVALGTPEIDLVVFLIVDLKSGKDDHLIEIPDLLLDGLYKHLVEKFESNPSVQVYPVSTAMKWNDDHEMGSLKSASSSLSSSSSSSSPPSCENTPPYLPLRFGQARFRIFLAPALASDPEEQRQAAYKLFERLMLKKGLKALVRLFPALDERPSEDIACERPEIHSFCRVCQYWIKLLNLQTLDERATEILSILAARHTLATGGHFLCDQEDFISSENSHDSTLQNIYQHQKPSLYKMNTLDFYAAFVTFLHYCATLDDRSNNPARIIRPPCSVQLNTLDQSPYVVLDEFNPYRNYLQSLSVRDAQRLMTQAGETLRRLRDSHPTRSLLDSENTSAELQKNKSHCLTTPDHFPKGSTEKGAPLCLKDIFRARHHGSTHHQPQVSSHQSTSSCVLSSLRRSLFWFLAFLLGILCIVEALFYSGYADPQTLLQDCEKVIESLPDYTERLRQFILEIYIAVTLYLMALWDTWITFCTNALREALQ